MPSPSHILRLSNELLREILDYIEADPNKLVSLDRRGYLSQESFATPPPPLFDQVQDIGNVRLVCQRLSELGAIHQFARISTRFSKRGLERLEKIASHPHLAKHVRKFSYMVPYFFVEGRARLREILPLLDDSLGALDVRNFDRKAAEQSRIVHAQTDFTVLRVAARAFTALQHVQILRLQDEEDALLLKYLRQHSELAQFVELKWDPAYRHSALTIGKALIASRSPCSRFSTPMATSVNALAQETPIAFKGLATKLTSLELHFDDGSDLDRKMREMSPLFKEVFEAAINMQSIHIGFPSHRPVSLKLDDVFQGIKWEKLSAFGIQAWKLDEAEIFNLVGRHRERLRGLRLRDVLLNEGSSWKNVLGFLRHEMPYLEWISLRRIGYTKAFDAEWMGAEIPEDPPGGASDSEDEDEDEDDETSEHHSHPGAGLQNQSTLDLIGDSDDEESLEGSDTEHDDDRDSQGHEMDFPQLQPDTPDSGPWCSCGARRPPADGVDNLGDNGGGTVTNEQRRRWERWVTRRCVEHPRTRRSLAL